MWNTSQLRGIRKTGVLFLRWFMTFFCWFRKKTVFLRYIACLTRVPDVIHNLFFFGAEGTHSAPSRSGKIIDFSTHENNRCSAPRPLRKKKTVDSSSPYNSVIWRHVFKSVTHCSTGPPQKNLQWRKINMFFKKTWKWSKSQVIYLAHAFLKTMLHDFAMFFAGQNFEAYFL